MTVLKTLFYVLACIGGYIAATTWSELSLRWMVGILGIGYGVGELIELAIEARKQEVATK